jgi:hypothetical protein
MFIARLPDLYVTANTTAVRKKNGLSPVRDPSFRLVVRPINLETGVQVSEIRMAVSRPFRVISTTKHPLLLDMALPDVATSLS